METTTIRVTTEIQQVLRSLAKQDHVSIQTIVEKAVSEYRRRRMLEEGNAAYAKLQADPGSWAEELDERRAWEATLADGFDAE